MQEVMTSKLLASLPPQKKVIKEDNVKIDRDGNRGTCSPVGNRD